MKNAEIVARAKAEIRALARAGVSTRSILSPASTYLTEIVREGLMTILFTEQDRVAIPIDGTLRKIVDLYSIQSVVEEVKRQFRIPEWIEVERGGTDAIMLELAYQRLKEEAPNDQ